MEVCHAVWKEGNFNKGLNLALGGNNIKRHITKEIRGRWGQSEVIDSMTFPPPQGFQCLEGESHHGSAAEGPVCLFRHFSAGTRLSLQK